MNSLLILKTGFIQTIVPATLCQELGMLSLLNDPSVVDHHDPVCAGDGGETVGDDESCPPFEQPRQGAL